MKSLLRERLLSIILHPVDPSMPLAALGVAGGTKVTTSMNIYLDGNKCPLFGRGFTKQKLKVNPISSTTCRQVLSFI